MSNRPILPPFVCALLVASLLPVAAQEQASPQALNDCTALTDPARLEQCVVTEQGGRKIRGRLSAPRGASANAPIYKDSETPEKTLTPLPGAP